MPMNSLANRSRRTRLVRIAAAVAPIAALVPLTLTGHSAQAAVPVPSGWTTVWSDDFNGSANSGLNKSDWLYDYGHGYNGRNYNWGTGEIESVTDSTNNVYQDGSGHLVIKAIRDGSGNWTSGRIETQRIDFQPPQGGVLRVESSIQQPNLYGSSAQGYWPAFWMLGGPGRADGAAGWPSIGEIDVLENVNGSNNVYGTFHCGVSSGGPCNETNGLGSGAHSMSNPGGQYHTYAIEWDRSVSPETIRWYLDGNQYFSVRSNQVDSTTWANATNHGFFIIYDLAIGGSWAGAPTNQTQSGGSMLIDYVAVYSKGGTPTTPATPTGLHAITTTSTSVRLGWNASSSSGAAVSGYDVYDGDRRVTGTSSSTTVTIDGLTPGSSHTYRVAAHTSAGVQSSKTDPLYVTTLAAGPRVPTDLHTISVGSTSVRLGWTASPSTSTTGYDVYSGTTRLTGTSTSTTVTVTGLRSNTTYTFTVKAHDSAGRQSYPSNAVTVKTNY